MNRINFIFLTLGLCLGSCVFASTVKYRLIVKLDKTYAVIGTPITLTTRLVSADAKSILWDAYDSSLVKIKKIRILSIRPAGTGQRAFEHTVIFTAVKPGDLVLDSLPVIVNSVAGNYTAFTKPVAIKFKNEQLLTSLNDIKQINESNYLSAKILSVFFLVGLFLLLAGVFAISVFNRNKRKRQPSIYNIQQTLLDRINLLEMEITAEVTTDKRIADQIFDVLKEYLEKVFLTGQVPVSEDRLIQQITPLNLRDQEKKEIINLLETSKKIRFSYQNKTPDFLSAFLYKLKTFIINSSPPKMPML
jgi:hypothetical protein